MKMTIKNKIIITCISLVLTGAVIIGGVGAFNNYRSATNMLEQTMTETVAIAAERIQYQLQEYAMIAAETGANAQLTDMSVSNAEKEEILTQKVETYGFKYARTIAPNGMCYTNMTDYSDRDYFKASMRGEIYISEPLIAKSTGAISVIISAPIWLNGNIGGQVAGVVYFVPDPNFLNDIVSSISVSKGSYAYIIDAQGYTIADPNPENVANKENIEELAQSDKSLKALAEIHALMRNGESGFGGYSYNGQDKFVAYAPIAETNGWSVAINSPRMDFLQDTYNSILITIICAIAIVAIAIILSIFVGNYIANPIKLVVDRIVKLAQGDLKSETPMVKTGDETELLSNAVTHLVTGMNTMLGDCDYLLTEMSKGNFAIKSKAAESYVGDFENLLESIRKINHQLTNTLSQINTSAEEVFAGSNQVSNAAQALSQGATEQASSTEELAATINEIATQIEDTAASAKHANELAQKTEQELVISNQQMANMTQAMEEISSTSSEIGKIIKTIEDIAFQTNILALNAAVEAARAGAAGKGFAVVADEVRNLAGKSAEASKNTSELIEKTLKAIENGSEIATLTAQSLESVSENTKQTTGAMAKIATLSENQAMQVSQITVGVDQISAVTQTNSATAEESAAASEELSGQATLLKNLIGEFTLE